MRNQIGLKLLRAQRNLQVVESDDPDPSGPNSPSSVMFARKADRDAILHGFVVLRKSVQQLSYSNRFRRSDIEGLVRHEISGLRRKVTTLQDENETLRQRWRCERLGVRSVAA